MDYRKLGSSDLEVSEISLGSWLTYGVGVEADKARACLDEAFAQGINFIDTANGYGRGAAEIFLGEVLQDRPRDSYVLATKVFFPMTDSDRLGPPRQESVLFALGGWLYARSHHLITSREEREQDHVVVDGPTEDRLPQ